jgi:hypothetical protein
VHFDARGLDFIGIHILSHASESKRVWVSGAPKEDFSRFSTCTSGCFQCSGRRSVARHSEAAPSPGGFSRDRVSNGDGGVKMKVRGYKTFTYHVWGASFMLTLKSFEL